MAAANTADPFNNGATDLSNSGNYASPPGNTSDVEFTGTYTSTTLDLNGAALNYGTLNDLDATQALTITNTSGTAGSITLNGGANSVAPSSADLLYVAGGGNLTIQNGTSATTLNIGANGNIDDAGALNLNSAIALGGNTLNFTGAGNTTINGAISGTGGLTINNAGGNVTLTATGDSLTGAVVVNGGTLTINATGNTGNGVLGTTSSITINSGGTIAIIGNNDNGFIGSGGYGGKNITVNAGGVLTSVGTRSNHLGTLVLAGGTLADGTPSGAGTSWGVYNLDHGVISGGTSVTSTISAQNVSLTQGGGTIFNVSPGSTPSGIDLNVTGTIFRNQHPGDTGLIKTGNGVMALAGANGYTSATTVSAGTLELDFSQTTTAPQTNIINTASNLVMNGGTLLLNGSSTAANSQQVNGLSVSPGASSIALTSNGHDLYLNVGAMNGNGGTVDFTLPTGAQTTTNGIHTTSTPAGGIFAYATVGKSSFATVNGVGDIVAASLTSTNVPSGGVIPNAPTSNIQVIGGIPGIPTGISPNATINSLTDSVAGTAIIDPGTGALTIGTGGLLVGSGAGSLFLGTSVGGGTITAGTGGNTQLVLNNLSGSNLTVNSVIANNGSGVVSLAASGTGSVTLNAANTFGGDAGAGAAGLILDNPLALQNANYASAHIIFSSLVSSNAFTVGGLKGNYTMSLTNDTGQAVALTFGQNNQNNTFAGAISGSGSLIKVGTGIETLSTANTFTGGLYINQGEVIATTGGSASSLGNGPVIVGPNGTLLGNGQDSFGYGNGVAPTNITINGGTVTEAASGTYRITLPDITFTNGGLLSDGGDAGDGNGNFSFRGNPARGGSDAYINVLPSANQATITANKIWMQATNVHFNVQRGTSPVDLLVTGSLINGGNFIKDGNGIMSLNAPASYSGGTTLNGGTVILDHSLTASNLFPAGLGFIEGGGTLLVKGNPSSDVSELFDSIAFFTGASGLAAQGVNGHNVSVTMDFIINRTTGATVNFTPPGADTSANGLFTATYPVNGILGGFTTVNNTDWATTDPNVSSGFLNPIIPLPDSGYTNVASGAIPDNGANNIRFPAGTSGTITLVNGGGTTSANTLLHASSAAVTVDIGGNGGAAGGGTLNLGTDYGALEAQGGVLVQPGAGALTLGTAPNSGILTTVGGGANGGGELVFFNNSSNPLTINSKVPDNGGGTALTVAGSGLVILAGDNTYAGQTTIGAGTLQVGTGGTNGQIGTGPVVNNGALIFDRSNNLTVSGAINGSGSVTQSGTGMVTLTQVSNFSGGLVINSGTVLSTTAAGGTALGTGTVTVNAAGTLMGGAGAKQNDSFGYTVGSSPSLIVLNGGTITEAAGSSRVTLPNLTFNNGGTLTNPTGTNGNTGDGSGNYSFNGFNGSELVTVNAGTNTAVLSATTIGIQNNTTFNVNRGTAAADLNISSVLSNWRNGTRVTFTGNGISTLSAANTFNGGLFVAGGTVISTSSGGATALGTAPVTVYSGGTLLGGASDSFGWAGGQSPSTINIAGGTVSETAGNFRVTLPNITFSNGGTLTSPAGYGDAGSAGASGGNYSFFGGTITVNPGPVPAVISASQVALQAGTVNFSVGRGSSPTDLVVNSILAPFGGGTQGIAKNGTGVMSLTAANTYSGTTAINAGTLLANNTSGSATGSGAVTVASGAALAGNGTITGPATVNAGGILSAGDAYTKPGQLALAGATTLAGGNGTVGDPNNGATYLWKMNNAAGSAGNSSGWDNLAFNTLSISSGSGGNMIAVEPISIGGGYLNTPVANFVASQPYKWAIATVSSGGAAALAAQFHLDTNALSTFATANNTSPNYFSVSSDPNAVYIVYTPTPEPTSLGLAALGMGGLLLRRRRGRKAL